MINLRQLDTIKTYEEYKALYKRTKARLRGMDSNCLLPGRTIRECLAQGDLYYMELPQGAALFIDEERYIRLYYYLDMEQPFPDLRCDKLLLLEEVDSNDRRKAYLDRLLPILRNAGYTLEAHNLQVEIYLPDHMEQIRAQYEKAAETIRANGLRAVYYSAEEQPGGAANEQPGGAAAGLYTEILDLWSKYLKPSDVPVTHTRFDRDREQVVLCVLDEPGRVCGVNWWIFRGTTSEIRHTVTHPGHYRKGIGNYMMLRALTDAAEHGCHLAIGYADVTNDKSLGMLEKSGFYKNGKESLQFVLESI